MTLPYPHVTEERTYEDVHYVRVTDDTPTYPRGTVVFPHLVDSRGQTFTVWGYPRTLRIYVLERGVRRYFKEQPFFVEEKIDGYNVRLVWAHDRLLALTRGGFVCPYTTEWASLWAEHMGLEEFFRDHPDLVLCGEAVGASPYNAQDLYDLPPGLHFYLFDILRPDGAFLPPDEKYLLAARYAIPTVPQFGQYSLARLGDLKDLLLDLNARGREGVVMKSPTGERVVKFVTPFADLADIRDNLILLYDVDTGFYTNRLLRVALFVQEFGLDPNEYALRIGESVLRGLAPLAEFQDAAEEYRILVRNISTWHRLRELLGARVRVEEVYTRPVLVDGRPFIQVGFRRVFRKSTKRFRTFLKGYGHYD